MIEIRAVYSRCTAIARHLLVLEELFLHGLDDGNDFAVHWDGAGAEGLACDIIAVGISHGYHIVPLALAWDLGARNWSDDVRLRFANDPANLIAVAGKANQDKGDSEPALSMPADLAFRCQYAMQFIAVLRG